AKGDLINDHNNGVANENGEVEHPDGTVTKATTDPDTGAQCVEISHKAIPKGQTQDADDGSDSGDDNPAGAASKSLVKMPVDNTGDKGLSAYMADAKAYVANNKVPIGITLAGIVTYKIFVNQPQGKR